MKSDPCISFEPTNASVTAFHDFRYKLASCTNSIKFPNKPGLLKAILNSNFTGKQRQFISQDDLGWSGHVLARHGQLKTESGQSVGTLGFFEAQNQPAEISSLLRSAALWLKRNGCDVVIGPLDGDTWHSYRFNLGPADDPPFLSEPINPAYYPAIWKAAGFETVESYHSKVIDNIKPVIAATEPAFRKSNDSGYRFRKICLDQFEDELKLIYEMSIQAFSGNFLYSRIGYQEFLSLYQPAGPLLNEDLVWFAEDASGRPVGFLFCLINYFHAVEKMKGKSSLLSKLQFALHRGSANAINFKSICVLKEHRRSSVAAGLMHCGYKAAAALGFNVANLCLIKDGNPSTKLDGGMSRILRRYELYQFSETQVADGESHQRCKTDSQSRH